MLLLLFIIYMNDVADNIKHSKIRLFADGNIIILYKEIMSEVDVQKLQEDLKSWENTWLLEFSIPRCYILKFTRYIKYKITASYYLHGTPLEIVENTVSTLALPYNQTWNGINASTILQLKLAVYCPSSKEILN